MPAVCTGGCLRIGFPCGIPGGLGVGYPCGIPGRLLGGEETIVASLNIAFSMVIEGSSPGEDTGTLVLGAGVAFTLPLPAPNLGVGPCC